MAEVKSAAKMLLSLEVENAAAFAQLAAMLPRGGDAKGEVLARLKTGLGSDPLMRLGRDFVLDGELADLVGTIPGVAHVTLTARGGSAALRLVA